MSQFALRQGCHPEGRGQVGEIGWQETPEIQQEHVQSPVPGEEFPWN